MSEYDGSTHTAAHTTAPTAATLDVFELSPAATCIGDVHGNIYSGNAAFRELFHWRPEVRPNLTATELLDSDSIAWLTDLEHRLADAEFTTFNTTVHFRDLDGDVFGAIVNGNTFTAEGRHRRFVVITVTPIDPTDRAIHDPFRRALETQNALICEWSTDGTYLFTNAGYREFFGHSGSIVGRNINDFITDPAEQFTHQVVESLSSGTPSETLTRNYPDGRSVEWTNTLLRAADGHPISVISVGRDVTDRAQALLALERSEQKFRTMVANIWDSVMLLDRKGQLIESTLRYRSDLDYPPEFWVTANIAEVVHPDDRALAIGILRDLIAGGLGARNSTELRGIRNDGSVSWQQISGVNLLDDPAVQALVLTMRTIDERKQVELELAAREAEAQAALRNKLGFIAKVSHELRNPLHGMLALSELLDRAHLPLREAKAAAALHRQSVVLRRIVDDLLDIAQLEIGQLRIHSTVVDVSRVINDAVMLAAGTAPSHLDLRALPVPPRLQFVVGDEERIRQMVANLLSNALKHTTAGGVTIEVTDAAITNGARISVIDTGSGIDPDDIPRLFEPYERGRGEGTAGVGLGLAIVKGLAEQMHGAVGAERRSVGGSHFWIELPLVPVEVADTTTQDSANTPAIARGLHVLVVDDDPVNLLVASLQLAEFEAQVTEASNGERALELLRQHRFDIAFIDVQMPGISGLEVVRRLRADRSLPQPFVAVMTASATSADQEAALSAGADTFVAKPASLADVGAAIREFTQR